MKRRKKQQQMITPTKEQKKVIDDIIDLMEVSKYGFRCWSDLFYITIGGYAGTGKTTLIAQLRKEIYKQFQHLDVAFVTFTGKASSVLQTKMEESNTLYPNDYVGTIHRLIYKPKTRYDKTLKTFVITGWTLKKYDELSYDLIIIDEASMVSKDIWDDLCSLERPIIAVGDHGQLPPIDSNKNFNLMGNPQYKLNNIHRQALNSPIIQLSQMARTQGYIPFNKQFSKNVFKLTWRHKQCKKIWDNIVFDENVIALCGFNTTRCYLNKQIRDRLNYKKKPPYPSERIICLKNDHRMGLTNGQIGTVLWVMADSYNLYRITIALDGMNDPTEVCVADKCFGEVKYTMFDSSNATEKQKKYAIEHNLYPINYFDYGYCISVHKSQGSEWNKVVLFEQRSSYWDDAYYARWLYTGITRAKEKLFIISDFWG
jgi:exodeoxyribonuclease-5